MCCRSNQLTCFLRHSKNFSYLPLSRLAPLRTIILDPIAVGHRAAIASQVNFLSTPKIAQDGNVIKICNNSWSNNFSLLVNQKSQWQKNREKLRKQSAWCDLNYGLWVKMCQDISNEFRIFLKPVLPTLNVSQNFEKLSMSLLCFILASVDFLREESNGPERAGAIAVASLSGLIFGLRGGLIKKVTYATIGGLSMASVCYPREAAEYSDLAVREGNRYFVAWYHFLFGGKFFPCFYPKFLKHYNFRHTKIT